MKTTNSSRTGKATLLSNLILILCILAIANPSSSFAQSSFGIEYSSTSPTNYGTVIDISTVESPGFLGTVECTFRSSDSRHFLLIHTLNKSTMADNFRSIEIGTFSQVGAGPFLSTTLAHDGNTVIIATSYRHNNAYAVLAMTFRFSDNSILFQRSYAFNSSSSGPLNNYLGIQIQRRFNSNGSQNGFTIAVLGMNNNSKRLGMIELNANLSYVSSAAVPVQINSIPSSTSNDQFMVVIGETSDSKELHVIRYNTAANSFDFARKYSFANNSSLINPHITYNINISGARAGYFVAFTLADNSSTVVPFVFRASNNGTIQWNEVVLDNSTAPIGLEALPGSCFVVNAPTALEDPTNTFYRHYALNASSGSLIPTNCFVARIPNAYDTAPEFRLGSPNGAIITVAMDPTDWAVHKSGTILPIGSAVGFICGGKRTFGVSNFNISSNSLNLSEYSNAPANNSPRFHFTVIEDISGINCSSSKSGTPEAAGMEELSHGKFQVSIYPNPVSGNDFSLRIQSPQTADYQLTVTNAMGQVIHQQNFEVKEGQNDYRVSPPSLPAGMYMAVLHSGNELIYQGKFVRQ